MSQLSKECPVLRPFYGFMVPGPVVSKNGLTLAGQQGVQTMQVQQLNANHHELRPVEPAATWSTSDEVPMYCIYCAVWAPLEVWREIQCSTSTATNQ